MKRTLISTILLLFCLFPLVLDAQSPLDIEEQVSFDVSPTNPEPNEPVTLTVTSYMTDLNKANIAWYVNGSLFDSDIGLRNITFIASNAGDSDEVEVVITKREGGVVEKSITIAPADVTIVRQSLSFIPDFYQGKALSAEQSETLFIAIPHFYRSNGTKISSEDISFTWKIDGTVKQDESGVGRDTYIHIEDLISRPVQVSVEATPVESTITAREIKTFEYTDPEVIFYNSDPILGTLYNRALPDNFTLTDIEMEITAIPYYFSIIDTPYLDFTWKIDGSEVNNYELKSINKVSLRRTDGSSGSNTISLEVSNLVKIFQEAANSFKVSYSRNSNF